MKKLFPFLLGVLVLASFSSFTNRHTNGLLKSTHVSLVPPGDYLATFDILYGPDAGTYTAFVDPDDHTILLYVRDSGSNVRFVTGSGDETGPIGGVSHYAFTFNDDPTQEYHGFVFNNDSE